MVRSSYDMTQWRNSRKFGGYPNPRMTANDGSTGATETKDVTVLDSQEVTVPLMDQEEGKSTILIVESSGRSKG